MKSLSECEYYILPKLIFIFYFLRLLVIITYPSYSTIKPIILIIYKHFLHTHYITECYRERQRLQTAAAVSQLVPFL